MTGSSSELARRLGEDAEAVCREYLSNRHRSGNHWIVGDVQLKANANRPAGNWVEYVAPRVMLSTRDWALSHRRSTASTQHNVSAREGA